MNKIPLLTPNDVELRVGSIQQTSYGVYANLLVYKDARCDMRILDQTFGMMNWKREHSVINGSLFCTVSIWDSEKMQWIPKTDVGVPSNTESTKGESSDAFKRSCFNIGIGRELYSAPDIRIKLNDSEVVAGSNGKPKTYAKFFVREMAFDPELSRFTKFQVVDKDNIIRFDINRNKKAAVMSGMDVTPVANTQQVPDASVFNDAPWTNEAAIVCSECGTVIKSQKVVAYAKKIYGVPLCYNCQQKRG